jgi:hypothetical protein
MYAKAWTALLKSSGVKCAPIPAQRAVQVVVLASFDPAVFAVQGWVGPSLTDRCELHRLVRLRCAHWISLKMAPTGWQGSERTRSWLGSHVKSPQDPKVQEAGLPGCNPQKCCLGDIDSWSTNEITINWNAPLAWVAAYLDEKAAAGR